MDTILRSCDLVHSSGSDGSPVGATRREFSIDGRGYEIDLCAGHDDGFLAMVAHWSGHAHPVLPRTPGRYRRTKADRQQAAAVRAWAASRGITIEPYGRIPVYAQRQYARENAS